MSTANGVCLLKDCHYKWDTNTREEETILSHLLKEHKVVIADVHTVYNVNEYCKYWSHKIHSGNLQDYMHGINVHRKGEINTPQPYFLLNNTSNEDSCLRHKIHHDKLELVLRQQQVERESQLCEIKCLFCPEILTGDRFTISQHLYQDHSFTLGHPDNLVYTLKFIEHLRDKMARFECLYCDKTFRDYKTLREHMRKKLHKKLNPSNTEFDKYYVVNYREFGKSWKHLENDKDDKDIDSRHGSSMSREEEWADWEECGPDIKCLICDVVYSRYSDVKHHMSVQHHLDIEHLTAHLSYYKQVKLINYIRYMTSDGLCAYCKQHTADLPQHLTVAASYNINISDSSIFSSHDKIPDELYDDERYLFPALDDDFLLCCLKEDDTVSTPQSEEPVVIPEPLPDIRLPNIGSIT